MAKGLEKFIDMLRMKDDDYDAYDDYDDDFEDDDYDEFDDDFEDIPAPVVKKKVFKKEAPEAKKESRPSEKKQVKKESVFKSSRTSKVAASDVKNKIVPLKSSSEKGSVCVFRPQVFDDARSVSDALLMNRAVVVNLEGIDLQEAQRIADFISGSCHALSGHIERISNYIFIVTPQSIEISGDFQEIGMGVSSNLHVPSYNDYF